jgi:hypothetical protein
MIPSAALRNAREGNRMAGRDGTNGNKQSRNAKVRRRRVVIMGGAVGAFLAAAAMATGSAAPAKADFDDLLDPIIQPLLTSLSDAIAGFDPAAATDLTTWTDSVLNSLSTFDPSTALSSTAEPAAAAASSTSDSTSGTYDIPLTVKEVTEPTVQASIDGSSDQTLLVDTGSTGIVIPWQDLGLSGLLDLGFPTGILPSSYSGGIDYIYLTYDDASVDYGNGVLTTTDTPIDVEILSWPTSLSPGSPLDFQQFLSDNDVTGILGIGDDTLGPNSASPLESYGGVTVDIPQDLLVVGSNAGTPLATVDGAPTPTSDLYESVNGGTPVAVSDDVDSGGVYGTIPSSLESSVPSGTEISVYDNSSDTGSPLYSYTVTGSGDDSTAPEVVSGTSIDSGVEPFLEEPIYIDYTNDTLTFDDPLS